MKSLLSICALFVVFAATSYATTRDLEDGLYAEIATTKGTILIKLEYIRTPKTVANFVGLAEGTLPSTKKKAGEPFYDGLTFHRVVPDGIVQGGCPEGTGFGNPGYKFKDEFNMNLAHDKPGTVSMANSGKHTNGSQFFITHRAIPSLDRKHTVFGFVVEGMDVVNKIAQGDKMDTITIVRVGDKAKAFDPKAHFTDSDRKKAD